MLKNDDIVSIQQDLMAGKYHQVMSGLRRIGRPIKKAWLKSPLSDDIEKYKFTSNSQFKEFLVAKITKSHIPETDIIKDIPQHIQQLKNQLSRLALLLIIWRDDPKLANESGSESEKKRLRQQIKFKASVDKDDRYAINIALQSMVFILCQQSNNLIKRQEKTYSYAEDHALKDSKNIDEFNKAINKEKLISFISGHIERLNKFESHRSINVTNYELLNEKQPEIEKIGQAIKAFQTPNKKKKIIKYSGILLAFIASLACGLATGGAIFLVLPSLPILAISLGALIGLWGFSANFGFFSKNFPNFVLSFLKNGGISECIDTEGNRRQLSSLKKYLFLPLAILASLTVGSGTIAITYTTVLTLAAKLFPILAIIWPPLPLIIVGILATAVGITLTVGVLTATIEAIKNSQDWSWTSIKAKFKSLTTPQIIGYVLKGLLVLVCLFGLGFFRYTAGLDLYNLIIPIVGSKAGLIAAWIMGAFAYVPQAFFTIFSMQKLFRLFSPSSVQQEDSSPHTISLFSRIKSIYTHIYLIGNALGNAALVVVDSISAWSISGAIGCFFNSWSGNLPEPDIHEPDRKLASRLLVTEQENFVARTTTSTKSDVAAPTSDSNGKQLGEFKIINTKNNSSDLFPKESVSPPSPTRSENGIITNDYAPSSSHLFKLVNNHPAIDMDESRNVKTWSSVKTFAVTLNTANS